MNAVDSVPLDDEAVTNAFTDFDVIDMRVQNDLSIRIDEDAVTSVEQVNTVFFTGGSSGIPALRHSISAMLPNARHVEGNIFGSIGSGLAIEASKRYGI